MKHLTSTDTIPHGKHGFLLKQISVTSFDYRRTHEERVLSVIHTILCIALACRNRTDIPNLTLFPRMRKEPRSNPWLFSEEVRLPLHVSVSVSWRIKVKAASFEEISKQFIEQDAYLGRRNFLTCNSTKVCCCFLTIR